jgi:FKBP-type peptidyl-prolyl cis-trans isomerase
MLLFDPNSDSFCADDHFVTKIGVGKVIKGWDEGVPKMSLGERAKLTITPYNPHQLLLLLLGL